VTRVTQITKFEVKDRCKSAKEAKHLLSLSASDLFISPQNTDYKNINEKNLTLKYTFVTA